jgi:hypothetical protein
MPSHAVKLPGAAQRSPGYHLHAPAVKNRLAPWKDGGTNYPFPAMAGCLTRPATQKANQLLETQLGELRKLGFEFDAIA